MVVSRETVVPALPAMVVSRETVVPALPVMVVSRETVVPALPAMVVSRETVVPALPVMVVSRETVVPAALNVEGCQVEPRERLVLLLEQVVCHLTGQYIYTIIKSKYK